MRHFFLAPLLVALCAAGPPPPDPDWPCVQRLVPALTAETLWPGHRAGGDWHADPRVAELVQAASARGRSVEEQVRLVEAFVAARPGPEALNEAFAGLVEAINAQRGQAIDRLRAVARRLRALAEATSRLTAELRALPVNAAPAQRDEITSRRALMIREYEEIGRTVRYACEIPVALEAKLGRFAQALRRE